MDRQIFMRRLREELASRPLLKAASRADALHDFKERVLLIIQKFLDEYGDGMKDKVLVWALDAYDLFDIPYIGGQVEALVKAEFRTTLEDSLRRVLKLPASTTKDTAVIFTRERIAVIAAFLASMGLMFGGARFGCIGPPEPKPPVVNPDVPPKPQPEPVAAARQILIVHESRDDKFDMSQLVISLRKPDTVKLFEEKDVKVTLLDVNQQTWDGKTPVLLDRFKVDIEKVKPPAIFALDEKAAKVIHSDTLRNVASGKLMTLADILSLVDIHASGEEMFAAAPFVDCDFASSPEFVKGDITEGDTFEVLGPRDAEPTFEDAIEIIPREEWDGDINLVDAAGGGLDQLVTRIYNQGSEGACVSNATCQGTQVVEQRMFGKSVDKSAISLYKRVASSSRSGSMVSDNLKELLARGVLPLDSEANKAAGYKHVMPNTGFSQRMPDGWEETAKHFRGLEYYDIRSLEGFYTALLKGYPVVYGRSGHSICATRLVKRNGGYYVKYANSWGNWGDKGFGYDSESMIRQGARWAFALRSVVDPEPLTATVFDTPRPEAVLTGPQPLVFLKPMLEEREPILTQAP